MSVPYYGDFPEDSTVRIPFNTFSSDDPQASVTITNLVDADLMVHKDGGLTQIAVDGATISIDYDTITGNHYAVIDTSAHADYSTGSEYAIRMEGTTVDAGTVNAWIGAWSIERSGGVLALIKAGNLSANVVQLGGVTQSATDLKDFADAGYDPATNKVQGVVLCDTTTTNTDMFSGGTLATGTAAAIANGTITLASGHGISDKTVYVVLTGGTNAVGASRIATYSGAGDVFDVDPAWNATINGNAETLPSGAITYEVYGIPPAGDTYPMDVNVSQISNDATAADNAEAFFDGTGYAGTNNVIPTVTTLTGHTPQTGDSYALANGAAGFVAIDTVVDAILALLDNARAEPGQGAPPVNPDMATKLDYLYKAWRNKTEQTATTLSLYDDAGTTVDQKSTVSDNGTTATRGEIVTGP